MLDYLVLMGLAVLFIFAEWDYKLALLPNIPVAISLFGYGLFLINMPKLLFMYILYLCIAGGMWLFYARKHEMSLADCLLAGFFTFCSYPLYFAPLILFIILVPLFHKFNICCHYEKEKKLVKMIPPMFISLFVCFFVHLGILYLF